MRVVLAKHGDRPRCVFWDYPDVLVVVHAGFILLADGEVHGVEGFSGEVTAICGPCEG